MSADFKVVWYSGFERAVVSASLEHAAMWLGRYLDRAGLAVWKTNMSGSAADKLIESAEKATFTVEQVDIESLRPAKQPTPPSRSENKTQKAVIYKP